MADKKGAKMAKKTENARREFNLPDTESVIQDYACAMWRSVPTPGKMIITQNYLLWRARIGSASECVPFRKITDIHTTSSSIAIDVQQLSQPLSFSAFTHRDETYQLLKYLLKNPISYVSIESNNQSPSTSTTTPSTSTRSQPINGTTTTTTTSTSTFDFNTAASGSPSRPARVWGTSNATSNNSSSSSNVDSGNGQMEQRIQVDTQIGKIALQRAEECRTIGTATLVELSRQGEVLDEIEQHVENVHHNLDKTSRHIRGVESFGGSLANRFGSALPPGREIARNDHTVNVQRIERPIDVPVLYKHPNDSLSPATFRIIGGEFCVFHEGEQLTEAPKEKYPISCISSLVIRSRPQHLDIRFRVGEAKTVNANAPERLRFLLSHIQLVVNELSIRCGSLATVVFEKNAKVFEYNNPVISLRLAGIASSAASATRSNGSNPGLFQARVPNSIVDNAPPDVRAALQEQDRDIDLIGEAVNDVRAMAEAMKPALQEQDGQITRITTRVDSANARITEQDKRIHKLL